MNKCKLKKILSLILVPLAFNAVLFLPPHEFTISGVSGQILKPSVVVSEKPQIGAVLSDSGAYRVSPDLVKSYIKAQSLKAGVNPNILLFISDKESRYDPTRIGDKGHSRGLLQISDIYHPEVSDECAFDYKCAIRWGVKEILKGNVNEWSTWKFRNDFYADAIN